MKLRTKLMLAFLGISVLPLTVVTIYSYRSSQRALRTAAEAEAQSLAAELGQRMGLVTEDLGRRVVKLWEVPGSNGPLGAETRDDEAHEEDSDEDAESDEEAAEVIASLGDATQLLERLEFVPPPVPEIPEPPEPPAPAGGHAGTEGRPRDHSKVLRRVVIDFSSEQMQQQMQELQQAFKHMPPEAAAEVAAAQKDMARLVVAQKEIARIVALAKTKGAPVDASMIPGVGSEPPGSDAEAPPTRLLQPVLVGGDELGVPVRRDGQLLGTVNAKLNLSRVLDGVLSMTRTEQGEIPFALDSNHRIYTPREEDRAALESLSLARRSGSVSGADARAQGDWIVVTRDDPSGLTFGIARPLGGAIREMRRAYGRNLGLGLLMIAAAFIGIVPLSSRMTRNLRTLAGGVQQIASGDLDVRLPVRSKDEFGSLAAAFNRMAADLRDHERNVVEQERLRRELELCRKIQTDMLPHGPLRLGVAEIRGISIPAREVGGDFFNYFPLEHGELALLVGDVSGKGVGAALLMANIQATLRARLPVDPDLVRLAEAVDREIESTTPREVFLTLFVGVLEPGRRTLRYVNAGHNPQYILRGGGEIERLRSTGLPLGLYAGHGYKQEMVTLADGDLLLFYTDGIVEAENPAGELFGSARLESLLAAGHKEGLDALLARVERAIREFRGSAEPSDDATIMVLRVGSGDAAALA